MKGFAAQVNDVATAVLNDEIDLALARTYAALVRTVAQAISAEVSRARFVKERPDLTLEDE